MRLSAGVTVNPSPTEAVHAQSGWRITKPALRLAISWSVATSLKPPSPFLRARPTSTQHHSLTLSLSHLRQHSLARKVVTLALCV